MLWLENASTLHAVIMATKKQKTKRKQEHNDLSYLNLHFKFCTENCLLHITEKVTYHWQII